MLEDDIQKPFPKQGIHSSNNSLPSIPPSFLPNVPEESSPFRTPLTTTTQDDLVTAVLTEFRNTLNHLSNVKAYGYMASYDHHAVVKNIAAFEDDLLDILIETSGPLPKVPEPCDKRSVSSVFSRPWSVLESVFNRARLNFINPNSWADPYPFPQLTQRWILCGVAYGTGSSLQSSSKQQQQIRASE